MGFYWIRYPLKDFTVPTQEQFMEFLKVIDRALKRGKVVIYYQGGLGRTGKMAAAYWINKSLFACGALKKPGNPTRQPLRIPCKRKASTIWRRP